MKGGRIKIVVAFMTGALLGLIGLQYYLIKNLVHVEEERFDRLVSEALSSVVMQIDRKEVLNAVQEEVIQNIDTVYHQNGMTINKITTDSTIDVEKTIHNAKGFQFFTTSVNKSSPQSVVIIEENQKGLTKEEILLDENQDTIFISKFNLVTEVVTDLLSRDTNILTRLSFIPLDSLLNQELADRGIELKHEYGVIDREKNPIIISEGSDSLKIINSGYGVRLFPNNLTGEKSQLKVYFADTSSYILSNIAWMLGLSILFILTIGLIFFQTIRMLLRQKKITAVKNDLINNITHEFKTPLSTISIASEALADPTFGKDENMLKKYTGMISTENKRLTAMVESLLNAAAFESGNYKLSLETIEVHQLIEKVLSDNNEFLQTVNANIKTNFNAQESLVKIDEFHIANVFKNLIENAAKYNDAEPRIGICTYNENSQIIMEIKDNGIGISREHQKKIFDTFYRVPTGNVHNVKGNGIGLSYVYKMVTAHNGTISLKSKVGVGSTFIIKLHVIENE